MMRKNIAAMLCLGILALSANTAQATGGSNFAKCLRTPLVKFPGTIVGAAVATCANSNELCILKDAVIAAGLVDILSGPGPFTVYAPTDKAFLAIPDAIRTPVVEDPFGLLTTVLTYHVTAGEVDPRKALIPRQVSTLQGQTVFFNRGKDGPQVNQSKIDCQGVKTTNGLVWIIDSVLQPQYFPEK
jgi:uncharacterized surface protein with fasciclin (FAS1) repeats